MNEYAWEAVLEDGSVVEGCDAMPSPQTRRSTRLFRLCVPNLPMVLRVEVPSGGSLIFFRSNRIDQDASSGRVLGRSFAYLLGHRNADGVKHLLKLEPFDAVMTGWLSTVVEDDGRGELDAH